MKSIRKIRFSLKTAAALISVIALACAFPVQRYTKSIQHSRLATELEAAGANVGNFNPKYHTKSAADRIYETFGFPSFTHVYNLGIENQTRFDKELLLRGLRLRGLCFLSIYNSTFADLDDSEAIGLIANHANSNLRYILIGYSNVTTEDLIQLCELPSLNTIIICYCPNITSQGLKRLVAAAKNREITIHIGKGITTQ